MPDTQLPMAGDDIAPDIAARSAAREQERLLQTLRERAGGAPTPDAPPSDAPRPGDMPPMEPPDGRGGVSASLSIPADVIKGVTVQAPRAVAHGVLGGLVEAAKTGRELTAAWPVPPKVEAALGEVDLDAVAELIPPPETQTGKLIAGVAQFLTGFVAAGRMLKPWAAAGRAARTGKAMTQGAASDFAFFDAAEPGLANLIESQPELANPVTAFLATDPADEPATNRLKRTLEGLGLGAATDGFVAALKTMRRAVKARAAARDAASATPARPDPAALEQSIGEQIDADWAALGYDPDAPLVQLRRRETRDQAIRAEQRPIDADANYAEDIVRAEGLAPPASRRIRRALIADDSVSEDEVRALAGDGVPIQADEAIADAGAKEAETELDRALDALRSGKGQKQDVRGPSLATYLHRIGGLTNDGGEVAAVLGGTKLRPGLIRKKGLSLDEAAERAWEAGYLGDTGPGVVGSDIFEARPTPNDLLDALRKDVSGARVYPRQSRFNAAEQEFLHSLDHELGAAGVDLEKVTNQEAKRLLNGYYNAGVDAIGQTTRSLDDMEAYHADSGGVAGKSGSGMPAPQHSRLIINHLNINAPEDVHDAIQQIADARKGQLDAARRGVRSWSDTRQAAGARDAWADLMDQRAQRGEAIPTAERQLAMRELWISSAEKLTEAAEIAAKSPTPGNRFAFRRLLATHHAIQSEVIAARTETARALNQWRMPAGATRERLRAIEDALAEAGGGDTHDQLARAIAAFRGHEGEYARAIDTVARQGWLARSRDAALSIWINALLSGPKTHIANMISNTSVLGLAQIERRVGEGVSGALDSADGVAAGEAVERYHGMVEGLKDLFRLSGDSSFWRYLKGEVTAAGPEKIERAASKGAVDPLSAEAWGIAANTTPGRVIDFLSGAVKLPGAALEAEDFLFKSLNYRMELHALALRQATREVQAGAIPAERLKERMAALITDPPEQIRLDATEAALVNTFTSRPGWFGQGVMRTVSQGPALRLIMPFVRTPVNLFRFAAERSPAAPLVRQWRADIAAGGARRDLALARMATGTAIMMVAMDMAQNGLITGRAPSSPGEREMFFRDGKKEYAVKLGDRWVQVSRMDPLGTTLGIAGDLAATFAGDFDEDYEEDAARAVTAAIFAAAYNATSKTYLSGLSGLMRGAIYGGEAAENEIKSFIGTLMPTGAAEVARILDPVSRDAADLTDGLVRRSPWSSKELPKQRDLWGREVSLQSGLGQAYDVLSPAYSSREDAAPIDRELRALGYFPSKPGRRVFFPAGWDDTVGIDLRTFDPHLYWRYVELAGNGLKHPVWDLGLFDLANQIVAGKHDLTEVYRARPADRRAAFWQTLIADYRDRARKQLLDESPELRREIAERHRARRSDLLGEVP